jgi:CBS domain-containing protein
LIIVATDITRRKLAEEALDRSHTALQVRVADLVARAAQHEAAARDLRNALLLAERPCGERLSAAMDRLRAARTPQELAEANAAMPALARGLVEGGWRPEAVSQFLALNTDVVLDTLARRAIARQGPPPVPFVFLVMGSEGRREQTLCTDQDNAILFADPPPERRASVEEYFRQFGEWVCDGLALAGYAPCEGKVMARNPERRLSLSGWQECFTRWIRTQEGMDLLQTKIFFDFRCGFGEESLLEPLRETLRRELAANPSFFPFLTLDVLEVRPPLALFGGIAEETKEDQRKGFDIKMAMMPIVDFARVYALKHDIPATNTLERLTGLRAAGVLTTPDHAEISQVYTEMMRVRIAGQLDALAEGRAPDNLMELRRLTHLQRRTLRECFEQVRVYQGRLGREFTGAGEGVR